MTEEIATALNLKEKQGVRVTQVYPGYAADKAGVCVGDIFCTLDGKTLEASHPEDEETFSNLIRQYKPGTVVVLEGIRDGKPLRLSVRLDKPPPAPSELPRYTDKNFEIVIRELAFQDRMTYQLPMEMKGVLIEHVEHAGWAALARVAIDDILLAINDQPTPDVFSAEAQLQRAAAEKARRVTFFVQRGIHTLFLEVEPDWEDVPKTERHGQRNVREVPRLSGHGKEG